MAFEPGGYADKLGNRYEDRWISKQLLRLLNEEIQSVSIEPLGDNNQGVDLAVVDKNGITQYQQCKSRNASSEHWSISNLANSKILDNLKFHLDISSECLFALVTGVPATNLKDICESARFSDGNPEVFFTQQIKKIGEQRREIFGQFCDYMSLDCSLVDDRAKAYDYLRRTYIYDWHDEGDSYENLLSLVRWNLNGDPENIISSLIQFSKSNLRKILTSADVRSYLSQQGYNFRLLSYDNRILPKIENLQKLFDDSIKPNLIDNNLISRIETQEILKTIQEKSNVIIYGHAGYGKSGVLYELTNEFKKNNILYIPVRLDRQEPQNNTIQYGKELGLPESPVKCLDSIYPNKPVVLILDQLDALRWTNLHSSNSLNVCKMLVDEINTLQKTGRNISVIISCREFDLKNDTEIKNWLNDNKKFVKQEIKGFTDEKIKSVVEKHGIVFSSLNKSQIEILSSPLHLGMWVILINSNNTFKFYTSAQLLRFFWLDRCEKLEKAGISPIERNNVIEILLNYMECNSRLSAPKLLVSGHSKALTELQTFGILRVDIERIAFYHQSYLDFLIAERLLQNIYKSQGDIISWLGAKEKQSLFRREQLRQILSLLCEEDILLFEKNVKEILLHPNIRFHMKLLTLGILGQIIQPSESLCSYVKELLENDYWREHFLQVCYGNLAYIEYLIDNKVIKDWLSSLNQTKINNAFWLLRSVKEKMGDIVASVLLDYIQDDENKLEQIAGVLWFDVENDSKELFELRLKLVRKRVNPVHVQWNKLAKVSPERTIYLIEAVISSWETPDNWRKESEQNQFSNFEDLGPDEIKSFLEVAKNESVLVFDMLLSHVVRLTDIKLEKYDRKLDDWQNTFHLRSHSGYIPFPYGIVKMIMEAGKQLANNSPELLIAKIKDIFENKSPVIQQIITEILTCLPHTKEYADIAISWLIATPNRFAIGSGYRRPKWLPAQNLIQTLSPYCSDKIFNSLEDSIIYYHSPDERKLAEIYLPSWKEGYFRHFWGEAQYFLLPSLCIERRSTQAEGLIGVLNRKFEKYSIQDFAESGSSFDHIGSPIKKPCKLSDKAWYKIITNRDIPIKNNRWIKIGPDRAVESSVRNFSDSLRNAAIRQPERFAQFALSLPEDISPEYIAAFLDSIKSTKPSNETPNDEKADWKPAKIETIIKFLNKFPSSDNRSVANDFCWLIYNRAIENWPDDIIKRLLEYVKSYPDPQKNKLNMYSSETGDDVQKASMDDLRQNSLNCIRGIAALALGGLLREHNNWIDKLLPGLESAINDDHPSVRMAAIEACLPLLDINKNLAIDLFVQACRGDIRVAASHYAVYYFNCCFQSHQDLLGPIILDMVKSEYPEVAEQGAVEICARYIFHNAFEEEFKIILNGDIAQRKGIASVVAYLIKKEQYTKVSQKILLPLLNDKETEVLQEANKAFFNNVEIFSIENFHDLLIKYVETKAFLASPDGFLYSLENYSKDIISLADIVFKVCEVFVGPLADLSRNYSARLFHEVAKISPLLIRLYGQSEKIPDVQNRCLDAWDSLFEKRVGAVTEIMKDIDNA
jgi:hypothetical protein